MKICFWGDNINKALTGETPGGGELQIACLAKALARSGHDVVVLDCQANYTSITDDNVKVYPIEGWNKGIRIIRNLTHRYPKLYSSLKAQRADIYYCRIRDFRHIFAYLAARKVKAKFILGIASDLDIMSFRKRWDHLYKFNLRELWFFFHSIFIEIVYPCLIRKSDYIFVQHDGQKELLLKRKNRIIVCPNLIELIEVPNFSNTIKKSNIYVGSLDKRKGFDVLFRIIKLLPDEKFIIIGQPRDKLGNLIFQELKSFKNVVLFGRLSHIETLLQISKAKALISTSSMEGFPNIFIEAWACGIPVLSLFVDPGNIIQKESIGFVANGNFGLFVQMIRGISENDEVIAVRAKAYIETNHALNNKKVKEIDHLFQSL